MRSTSRLLSSLVKPTPAIRQFKNVAAVRPVVRGMISPPKFILGGMFLGIGTACAWYSSLPVVRADEDKYVEPRIRERVAQIKSYFEKNNIKLAPEIDLYLQARMFNSFSNWTLGKFLNAVKERSVGSYVITEYDLDEVRLYVQYDVRGTFKPKKPILYYDADRMEFEATLNNQTAKTLVGLLLGKELYKVTTASNSVQTGFTEFMPETMIEKISGSDEIFYMQAPPSKDDICILLAPHAAEQFFGVKAGNKIKDIHDVLEAARDRMAIKEDEFDEMIKIQFQRATSIISENQDKFSAIQKSLAEKFTLTGRDIAAMPEFNDKKSRSTPTL